MTRSVLGIHRIVVLAALLVLLVSIFPLASPVGAADSCAHYITTYYTNAAKTTAVGQRGYDCDCNYISWGVTTPYYRTQFFTCPDP